MVLGKLKDKLLSGYPGGYRHMRRGTQPVDGPPPFQLPADPLDRSSRIPPTGYREYWYPALPAKDIGKNKPEVLRMPGMSRTGGNNAFFRSTRWAVPVEPNLTRMVYLNVERYATRPGTFRRLWSSVTWPYRNWELNFNFRNQDYDAQKYVQFASPEYLSSTDSAVVAMRRLFVEHARDVKRRREQEEELLRRV